MVVKRLARSGRSSIQARAASMHWRRGSARAQRWSKSSPQRVSWSSLEHPGEPRDGGTDSSWRVAAKPEHECRAGRGDCIHAAHGANNHTLCTRGPFDGDIAEAAPAVGHQMHSLVGRLGSQMPAKAPLERRYERIALLAVSRARPAQVRGETAFAHEIGHSRLKEGRGLPVERAVTKGRTSACGSTAYPRRRPGKSALLSVPI
jgi:hypothetical protein